MKDTKSAKYLSMKDTKSAEYLSIKDTKSREQITTKDTKSTKEIQGTGSHWPSLGSITLQFMIDEQSNYLFALFATFVVQVSVVPVFAQPAG